MPLSASQQKLVTTLLKGKITKDEIKAIKENICFNYKLPLSISSTPPLEIKITVTPLVLAGIFCDTDIFNEMLKLKSLTQEEMVLILSDISYYGYYFWKKKDIPSKTQMLISKLSDLPDIMYIDLAKVLESSIRTHNAELAKWCIKKGKEKHYADLKKTHETIGGLPAYVKSCFAGSGSCVQVTYFRELTPEARAFGKLAKEFVDSRDSHTDVKYYPLFDSNDPLHASPDIVLANFFSPFLKAILKKDYEFALYLLFQGAFPGYPPPEMAKFIVPKFSVCEMAAHNLNFKMQEPQSGNTVLHKAAHMDLKYTDHLLKLGANSAANIQNNHGLSPIMYALSLEKLDCAELLAQYSDPKIKDESGLTPVHYCMQLASLSSNLPTKILCSFAETDPAAFSSENNKHEIPFDLLTSLELLRFLPHLSQSLGPRKCSSLAPYWFECKYRTSKKDEKILYPLFGKMHPRYCPDPETDRVIDLPLSARALVMGLLMANYQPMANIGVPAAVWAEVLSYGISIEKEDNRLYPFSSADWLSSILFELISDLKDLVLVAATLPYRIL